MFIACEQHARKGGGGLAHVPVAYTPFVFQKCTFFLWPMSERVPFLLKLDRTEPNRVKEVRETSHGCRKSIRTS